MNAHEHQNMTDCPQPDFCDQKG